MSQQYSTNTVANPSFNNRTGHSSVQNSTCSCCLYAGVSTSNDNNSRKYKSNSTSYTKKQVDEIMDLYNKTYKNSDGANSYSVNPPPIINNKVFYNHISDTYNNISDTQQYSTDCNTITNSNNFTTIPPYNSDILHSASNTSTNPLFNHNNIYLNDENNYINTCISNPMHQCSIMNTSMVNKLPHLSLSDLSASSSSINTFNSSNTNNSSNNLSNPLSNASTYTFYNKKKSNRGRKKIDRSEYLNKQGRYQCRLCPKSYKRYNDLKGHYAIHSENTQRCPYCKKKFTRPIYLDDHIRTHTGEKPFNCDVCRRKFSAKRNLVQHRKKHFRNDKLEI